MGQCFCLPLVKVGYWGVQAASEPFADSMLQLPATQLVRLGTCGGGSTVLEAFLDRPGGHKGAKRLLKRLHGSHGKLAMSPSGCFLVEKSFNVAVKTPVLMRASFQLQPVRAFQTVSE